MAQAAKRGPKRGKRVTPEVQTKIILKALYSTKTVSSLIKEYKEDGYNFGDGVEDDLQSIEVNEITFMLANRQLLRNIKEEAINHFISDIKSNK